MGAPWAAAGYAIVFGVRDPNDAKVQEVVRSVGGRARAATDAKFHARWCEMCSGPTLQPGRRPCGPPNTGIVTRALVLTFRAPRAFGLHVISLWQLLGRRRVPHPVASSAWSQ